MKQPSNTLASFVEDESTYFWVDIECGDFDGGMCRVGIASAKKEKTAYKRAAEKLQKMSDMAWKKYEELEDR